MALNRRIVLLVVAVVCFVVYSLFGFGTITGSHPTGWLGVGLAAFAAALL